MSRASVLVFVILVLMFLLDVATSIIDVNNAIREITLTLTSDSSLSLSDRYALTDNLPWPVQGALYAFMVCLSNLRKGNDLMPFHRTVKPRRRHYPLAYLRVLAVLQAALAPHHSGLVPSRFSQ